MKLLESSDGRITKKRRKRKKERRGQKTLPLHPQDIVGCTLCIGYILVPYNSRLELALIEKGKFNKKIPELIGFRYELAKDFSYCSAHKHKVQNISRWKYILWQ